MAVFFELILAKFRPLRPSAQPPHTVHRDHGRLTSDGFAGRAQNALACKELRLGVSMANY